MSLKRIIREEIDKLMKGTSFTDESTGYHNGQSDMISRMFVDGKQVAHVQYTKYNGKVYIQYIEASNRGKGYGEKLMDHLAKQYGYEKLERTSLTPDGAKMRKRLDKKYNFNYDKYIESQSDHISPSEIEKVIDPMVRDFLRDNVTMGYEKAWEKWLNDREFMQNNHEVDMNDVSEIAKWVKGSKDNNNRPEDETPYYVKQDFNKIIKKETIEESAEKGNTFYHGSPNPINKFSDEFVGTEEANDQEGPGIYFSSSQKDAKSYGDYVHKVELNPRKIVPTTGSASRKELKFLIKQSEDWEMNAQDWHENPEVGVEVALDSILQYNDNPHEQFTQVWIEFFKYKPLEYVRGMVKLGYDVTMIKKDDGIVHAVVLNPNIIQQEDLDIIQQEDLDIIQQEDAISETVSEEYPASFNMEHFKTLDSFNKRIKYCEEHLQRISSGSGRIAYKIDEEKVLKLAKNQKGVAQNEVEIEYSQDGYVNDLFANTYEYHPNFLWLEMELARKLKKSEFKKITGFSFDDFGKAAINHGVDQGNKGHKQDVNSDVVAAMWEDEFVYDVFDLIGSYDFPAGDLARTSSYGIVNRNGQDEVVLIDYGLNKSTYDNYYS